MDLLLDTHALIWFLNGDDQISTTARNSIEKENNIKLISVATIWEIAIKNSLNKLRFAKGLRHFYNMIDDNGFEVLPLSTGHAIELSTLEFIHRDPFDRMIVAQAIIENLTIVTKDEQIQKYAVKTVW